MQIPVLIIGAGVTGAGLARDLALRGIASLVLDKKDITAGASGGNHGLLHSGARYVTRDPSAARECQLENQRLKTLAPHCIEATGGLFAAVAGDDENYIADFAESCRSSDIPVQPISVSKARELEPALSEHLIAAFAVNDATVDPFRLALDNMSDAQKRGSRFIPFCEVTGFEVAGGRIRRTRIRETLSGRQWAVEADVVVNAAGAWEGMVASLAGAPLDMRYSKGSLLVTHQRITRQVINRLRPPTDGDILAPGGTVSILGTTSRRVDSPDGVYPEVSEVDEIIDEGAAMIPRLSTTRYIRAYCGVRPLVGETGANTGSGDDRSVSRGYALIDPGRGDAPVDNLVTITGGKLTTYRLMAEKTADCVCGVLGSSAEGRTLFEPLPDASAARWTEPGLAPHQWMRSRRTDDMFLCECEMVPQSVVAEIAGNIRGQGARPTLSAISLRSRIGKGPCQGTFCSQQVTAYLYDSRYAGDQQGKDGLCDFLRERWRGQQPLLWNHSLAQAELMEAMHCGFFSLERNSGRQ